MNPWLSVGLLSESVAGTETGRRCQRVPNPDILSAQRADILSILTLSGATDRARLATFDIEPDIVLQDITALVAGWRRVLRA